MTPKFLPTLLAATLLAGCTNIPVGSLVKPTGNVAPLPQASPAPQASPSSKASPSPQTSAKPSQSKPATQKAAASKRPEAVAAQKAIAGLNDALTAMRDLTGAGKKQTGSQKKYGVLQAADSPEVSPALEAEPTPTNEMAESPAPTEEVAEKEPVLEEDKAAESIEQEVPDVAYDQVRWYYTESDPKEGETDTEHTYAHQMLEEGWFLGTDGTKIALERYSYTQSFRTPKSAPWESGSFTKNENVELSQFRELGNYKFDGTFRNLNGRNDVDGVLNFTGKDGRSTKTTLSTSQSGNTWLYTVGGDNPGGGAINLTTASTWNDIKFREQAKDGGQDWTPIAGSSRYTQNGTLTNKAGDAFKLSTEVAETYGENASYKGFIEIEATGKALLRFEIANHGISGTLFSADGSRTKLGTIAVNGETKTGELTLNDGTIVTLQLEPLFDVMDAAGKV